MVISKGMDGKAVAREGLTLERVNVSATEDTSTSDSDSD
jgi:hypothetical protein